MMTLGQVLRLSTPTQRYQKDYPIILITFWNREFPHGWAEEFSLRRQGSGEEEVGVRLKEMRERRRLFVRGAE